MEQVRRTHVLDHGGVHPEHVPRVRLVPAVARAAPEELVAAVGSTHRAVIEQIAVDRRREQPGFFDSRLRHRSFQRYTRTEALTPKSRVSIPLSKAGRARICSSYSIDEPGRPAGKLSACAAHPKWTDWQLFGLSRILAPRSCPHLPYRNGCWTRRCHQAQASCICRT
jgi:hypothetical protein